MAMGELWAAFEKQWELPSATVDMSLQRTMSYTELISEFGNPGLYLDKHHKQASFKMSHQPTTSRHVLYLTRSRTYNHQAWTV